MISFGDRLDELISDKNITVSILCEAINCLKSEICHWRVEDYMPSMKWLIKLADYFCCTVDYLIGRSDKVEIVKPKHCPPFAERFPRVVKKSGKNYHQIILATKISSSTIHEWKKGKFEPQLESLIRLADYFDCTIDYLLGRE